MKQPKTLPIKEVKSLTYARLAQLTAQERADSILIIRQIWQSIFKGDRYGKIAFIDRKNSVYVAYCMQPDYLNGGEVGLTYSIPMTEEQGDISVRPHAVNNLNELRTIARELAGYFLKPKATA